MAIAEVDAIGVSAKTKPADKLVLVDAYWIKNHEGKDIKIRLLPHQMPVDLFLEFVYEFDDDKHDKDAASAIDVKFKVEGTIFDEKSTITIDSSKIKEWFPVRTYNGPKVKYLGKKIYKYTFKNFQSDLYPLEHRVGVSDELIIKDAWLLNKTHLNFKNNLSYRGATNKIVLHCSATCANIQVEEIHQMHLDNNWAGIGYHYYIGTDGTIWEGRPEDCIGAHVQGLNSQSIGVCYCGGIDANGKSKDTRNEKQIEAMIKLCRYLHIKYPEASFHGHNEFANKDCPCFDVNNWMSMLQLEYSASEQTCCPSFFPFSASALFLVLGFKYNKNNFDKNAAEIELKYSFLDNTNQHNTGMSKLIIKGRDLLDGKLASTHFNDIEGNECFLVVIDNIFSSDKQSVAPIA